MLCMLDSLRENGGRVHRVRVLRSLAPVLHYEEQWQTSRCPSLSVTGTPHSTGPFM